MARDFLTNHTKRSNAKSKQSRNNFQHSIKNRSKCWCPWMKYMISVFFLHYKTRVNKNIMRIAFQFTLNAIVFPPSGSPTIIKPCRTIIISYTFQETTKTETKIASNLAFKEENKEYGCISCLKVLPQFVRNLSSKTHKTNRISTKSRLMCLKQVFGISKCQVVSFKTSNFQYKRRKTYDHKNLRISNTLKNEYCKVIFSFLAVRFSTLYDFYFNLDS